ELTVDDYALPAPSSRGQLSFVAPRNGAVSRCDLILDISGGPALFAAADLRDGYLRADPADPAAVLRAVLKARDLTGAFDKPRYIEFTADICAHARSQIVGCHRCLDLCPAGAITPAGDHVAIDAHICAGCGQCAAACPTGAAANVLPLEVNEVTQMGLEVIAACFAYGASAMRFLIRAKPRHDITGLSQTLALAEAILAGLGFGEGRVEALEVDDPDALAARLWVPHPEAGTPHPASFVAAGGKRDVMRLSLRELHRVAPAPIDIVPLPQGAPFGAVEIDVAGCTLCLACVSACPTGALRDNPEQPMLRFLEDACVQC